VVPVFTRAKDARSASFALLHVAHVQPVCKAASAIALLPVIPDRGHLAAMVTDESTK